uniref:zinc finger protein 143-like n=2 Tax=Myxine glutinosa TaxID=7769 RepID=UPI00358E7236
MAACSLRGLAVPLLRRFDTEGYDTISVQTVQLEDGTTAYIHLAASSASHTPDGHSRGSAHPAIMNVDSDALCALEQYATVNTGGEERVSLDDVGNDRLRKPSRPVGVTQVGEKAFRCNYVDCGRPYTAAHHLKRSSSCEAVHGHSVP